MNYKINLITKEVEMTIRNINYLSLKNDDKFKIYYAIINEYISYLDGINTTLLYLSDDNEYDDVRIKICKGIQDARKYIAENVKSIPTETDMPYVQGVRSTL